MEALLAEGNNSLRWKRFMEQLGFKLSSEKWRCNWWWQCWCDNEL